MLRYTIQHRRQRITYRYGKDAKAALRKVVNIFFLHFKREEDRSARVYLFSDPSKQPSMVKSLEEQISLTGEFSRPQVLAAPRRQRRPEG
jgi:hypothetical protein